MILTNNDVKRYTYLRIFSVESSTIQWAKRNLSIRELFQDSLPHAMLFYLSRGCWHGYNVEKILDIFKRKKHLLSPSLFLFHCGSPERIAQLRALGRPIGFTSE